MKKKISLLGSTGSIGTQTLDIVSRFSDRFEIVALAAGQNIQKLTEQIETFRPLQVCVANEKDADALTKKYPDIQVGWGSSGLLNCVEVDCAMIVVGISGTEALRPVLRALDLNKDIALANKESLVIGGSLLQKKMRTSQSQCIPVDSEHNGLFQLLAGQRSEQVATMVLTASGGPLLRAPDLPLEDVTAEFATNHPNWNMGPVISVDSATMMNKGLELIEAHYLFDFPQTRIEVYVHPQSIVHSALWLTDNTCLAQLSRPDMRACIGHAMAHPERLPEVIPKLTFAQMSKLEFFEPDTARFPALRLAREALDSGPSSVIALNAANEIAVKAFLKGEILFPSIAQLTEKVLEENQNSQITDIEDVFSQDEAIRRVANQCLATFRV